MSKAYKCDRCGELCVIVYHPAWGIRDWTEIDLCESCNADFNIWWKRVIHAMQGEKPLDKA